MIGRRKRERLLCLFCDPTVEAMPQHTSPPNGYPLCECEQRTCACYGYPPRRSGLSAR